MNDIASLFKFHSKVTLTGTVPTEVDEGAFANYWIDLLPTAIVDVYLVPNEIWTPWYRPYTGSLIRVPPKNGPTFGVIDLRIGSTVL